MKSKPRYNPGDKIGNRYQVHQTLMGSMGEVYLCLDLEQNYPFALKTFQSRFLTSPKLIQAFYAEVETWIALEKHPNIVRCFYLDSIDQNPFMFLEWIASEEGQGTDLRSWLRGRPLDLELALTFATDIARGLLHAGKKKPGIVHRDMKPENILIAQGNVAKITDFGLASIFKGSSLSVSNGEEATTTHQSFVGTSGIVGTPAYMSPEQWRAEEQDVRTDIYGLGCILYEMLTGRLPYAAKTLNDFMQKHLHDPLPFFGSDAGSMTAVTPFIHRCLAKDPLDRFSNVEEFLAEMKNLFQQILNKEPRELKTAKGFTAIDYNYRGVTYDKLDRYDEALADYGRSLELDPSFVLAYNNRGATYERLRRYKEAIDDYSSAIEQDSSLSQAYYNRGNVYSKQKRRLQAIKDLSTAIDLDKEFMRAYINRGSEYYAIGKLQEALEDFSIAIKLNPAYAKAYVNRGVIYDSLGEFDNAVSDYSHAIQLFPDDAAIYYNRGLTYLSLHNFQKAEEDFTNVIALNPQDNHAYYYRGICFMNMGNNENAIADHSKAIQLGGSNAFNYLNMGALLYNRGFLQEALHNFQEALMLGDPNASEWIALIQRKIG